ncbi:hypothetical protein BGX38DRAFT_1332830 [Terfezia claveryi]|nr:hypothetical protein BGX38DRAFT_1332830 [Terfezia claveryi]
MSARRCKHEIIEKWRKRIAEIGLPRQILIMVNGHEVPTDKNNKTAIKGRFYPRNDLKKLLTLEVVEDILNHDCPTYCDQQRRTIEKLDEDSPWASEQPRHASNKSPELSRRWAEQTCGTDGTPGAVTIFGLLVLIRRPLLIVGFLDKDVTDQGFEQVCDLLVEGPGIFDYWRHYHERAQALSEKAAETFRKQMWSFVPPKIAVNVAKITTQSFRRERILPFIERPQLMGQGGYSSVYKARIHEDYFVVPAEFKADAYALKQVSERNANLVEIKKEIETLRLVQKNPHDKIIRFLAVYEHVSLGEGSRPPACNFLMPLMDGNLKEYLRGEGSFTKDTANGLKALVEGKLYEQLIGLVGALHHMVHNIQMHRIDLKPDNILVKREQDGRGSYNDILILADFGQARVKRSRQYTKTGMGVTFAHAITDAYAPPEAFKSAWREADLPSLVKEDKWDIWPLGCIFVEILTFLALGQQGVHKLDLEREKDFTQGVSVADPDEDSNSDCRFWVTESHRAPRLKQSIKQWLTHLENLKFDSEELDAVIRTKCRNFMIWNIRLSTAMLNPWPSMNITTRCSISEVVETMKQELLADTDGSLITPMDTARLDRLLGFRTAQFVNSEAPAVGSTPTSSWPDMQRSPEIPAVPRILEPEGPSPALPASSSPGNTKSRSSIDSETSTIDSCEFEQRPDCGHAAPGVNDVHGPGKTASPPDGFSIGPGLFGSFLELGVYGNMNPDDPPLEPRANEMELLQMSDIGYYMNGDTGKGRIMVCNASKGPGYDLVIRMKDLDGRSQNLHILREKTSIVPLHIVSLPLLKSYNQIIGHEPTYVIQFDGEKVFPGTGLHTSNATHVSNLLEILTQQRVLTEMRLKRLILRREKRKLMTLFQPLHDNTYNAIRAEIWIELAPQTTEVDDSSPQGFRPYPYERSNTDTSIGQTSTTGSTSSHGNRSLSLPGYGTFPATRRLVIYCKAGAGNPEMSGADTIYSIKFDGGLLPQRDDQLPNVLRVYRAKVVHGTHKDQVSVYRVSYHHLPGMPMSPVVLRTKEQANEIRCSAVDLEFHNRQDALNFSIACHREYQQYADELRASES